jgi:hypothetical protein
MDSLRYLVMLLIVSLPPAFSAQKPDSPPQAPPAASPTATSAVPAKTETTYSHDATVTQTENTIHIADNSPRPLSQVGDALRLKYGWFIAYEDSRYSAKLDILERPGPAGTTLLVPAGGAFSVDVPGGPSDTPPAEKTLGLIVDAYNQSKNPGKFELRKIGDNGFDLVGVGAQDDKGKMTLQDPILDSAITVPNVQRTATETVRLICETVSKQTHVPVTLGITPRTWMDHKDVKVWRETAGARHPPSNPTGNWAHDVLALAL